MKKNIFTRDWTGEEAKKISLGLLHSILYYNDIQHSLLAVASLGTHGMGDVTCDRAWVGVLPREPKKSFPRKGKPGRLARTSILKSGCMGMTLGLAWTSRGSTRWDRRMHTHEIWFHVPNGNLFQKLDLWYTVFFKGYLLYHKVWVWSAIISRFENLPLLTSQVGVST